MLNKSRKVLSYIEIKDHDKLYFSEQFGIAEKEIDNPKLHCKLEYTCIYM